MIYFRYCDDEVVVLRVVVGRMKVCIERVEWVVGRVMMGSGGGEERNVFLWVLIKWVVIGEERKKSWEEKVSLSFVGFMWELCGNYVLIFDLYLFLFYLWIVVIFYLYFYMYV